LEVEPQARQAPWGQSTKPSNKEWRLTKPSIMVLRSIAPVFDGLAADEGRLEAGGSAVIGPVSVTEGQCSTDVAEVGSMTIGEVKELFGYGNWANALIFETASALSEEQLHHSVASSFPSVGGTLAHIVGAEWVWLRRWLGESPSSFPDWVTNPVPGELRARLSAVEQEREVFLAGLSDTDLSQTVSYRTLGGQTFSDPLANLMKHVVNHSTYHRGQVVTQLRQLGQKPPSTDLILYLRRAR
jgi:uncharacterized damage-inducible protein DinB